MREVVLLGQLFGGEQTEEVGEAVAVGGGGVADINRDAYVYTPDESIRTVSAGRHYVNTYAPNRCMVRGDGFDDGQGGRSQLWNVIPVNVDNDGKACGYSFIKQWTGKCLTLDPATKSDRAGRSPRPRARPLSERSAAESVSRSGGLRLTNVFPRRWSGYAAPVMRANTTTLLS
ncbi:hypothetical protein [Streptomyces sp. NPDC054961]